MAVSKTLKFAKVGSLKIHCFGTAVERIADKRAEICFSTGWGLQSYFGFS